MTATTAPLGLLGLSELVSSPFDALLGKQGATRKAASGAKVAKRGERAKSAFNAPPNNDPTEYPDSEIMSREPVETEICLQLVPVLLLQVPL